MERAPRSGFQVVQPAFLICADPELDLQVLVQSYIYRWEIECNHRDEKSFIGVAEGQVRNPKAVQRLPQFQVAGYSLLLLASRQAYGFGRTDDYFPLPKWRRKSIRPSIADIIDLTKAGFAPCTECELVSMEEYRKMSARVIPRAGGRPG